MKPWHITQIKPGLFSHCEIDMRKDGEVVWIAKLEDQDKHYLLTRENITFETVEAEDRFRLSL